MSSVRPRVVWLRWSRAIGRDVGAGSPDRNVVRVAGRSAFTDVVSDRQRHRIGPGRPVRIGNHNAFTHVSVTKHPRCSGQRGIGPRRGRREDHVRTGENRSHIGGESAFQCTGDLLVAPHVDDSAGAIQPGIPDKIQSCHHPGGIRAAVDGRAGRQLVVGVGSVHEARPLDVAIARGKRARTRVGEAA